MPNYKPDKTQALGPSYNPAPDGLDDAVVYPEDVTGQDARYRRIWSAKRAAALINEVLNLNDAVFVKGGAGVAVRAGSDLKPGPVRICDFQDGYYIICSVAAGFYADYIITDAMAAGDIGYGYKSAAFETCEPLLGGYVKQGSPIYYDNDGNLTTSESGTTGQVIGWLVECAGAGADGTGTGDITGGTGLTDAEGLGCCLIMGNIGHCCGIGGGLNDVERIVFKATGQVMAAGWTVSIVGFDVGLNAYVVVNADSGETDGTPRRAHLVCTETLIRNQVGIGVRKGLVVENFSVLSGYHVGDPVYLRQNGQFSRTNPSGVMSQRVGFICKANGMSHADIRFDIGDPSNVCSGMIVNGAIDSTKMAPEAIGAQNLRYGSWHDNLLNSAHSITTGYDQPGANYATTQWRTFDNSLFSTSRVLTVGPAASGWEFTVTVEVAQFIDVFFPIGGQHLLYGGVENTNATSNVIGASITFHMGSLGWTVKSCSNPADWTIHS